MGNIEGGRGGSIEGGSSVFNRKIYAYVVVATTDREYALFHLRKIDGVVHIDTVYLFEWSLVILVGSRDTKVVLGKIRKLEELGVVTKMLVLQVS